MSELQSLTQVLQPARSLHTKAIKGSRKWTWMTLGVCVWMLTYHPPAVHLLLFKSQDAGVQLYWRVCRGCSESPPCWIYRVLWNECFDFKRKSPICFVSPVCALWVRHELGKMGISLQASLPVYCHFQLALLVCVGWSALGACPAQGEHGCSKTSPFLKGGIHSLSECLFTCTFILWVYKHLTRGKCKSLSSARCSALLQVCWLPAAEGRQAGCSQGSVQLPQPAVKSDNHHSLLETSAETAESLKGRKRHRFQPLWSSPGL